MPRRNAPLKVAVLISGRGSNLQALIDAFTSGRAESPVKIALALSNRPEAQGLARAQAAGIKTAIVDHKSFPERDGFDAEMDRVLRAEGIELVALAGFMRLLGASFIDAWRDRLINIHPSLLPVFKGLNTHARALEAGVRFHGCTVHFVRSAVDSGPIIAQAAVPVRPDDTPDSLADRVLAAEHKLYPRALRLIAEGKVKVANEKVTITDTAYAGGVFFNPMET